MGCLKRQKLQYLENRAQIFFKIKELLTCASHDTDFEKLSSFWWR